LQVAARVCECECNQVLARIGADCPRDPEVNVPHDISGEDHQVCRVQIRVKHSVLKNIPEKIIDDIRGHFVRVEAFGIQAVEQVVIRCLESAEVGENGYSL